MRIAIFSDVHGNLTALETVLADIKKQAPDAIAFAGDLCYFGARPAGCIERIKGDVDMFVYGNTDEAIFAPPAIPDDSSDEERTRWEGFYKRAQWYKEKLTPEQLGWLSRLPFSHRISPTPHASDDLLIVHANPKDVNAPVPPPESEQEEKLGKVALVVNETAVSSLFQNTTAAVVAYGHVHFPGIQKMGDITLANISSASLPMTKDGLARYAILTWNKSGWDIDHRAIQYNFGKEQELLSFLQPPGWEIMAKGLG